MRVSSLISSLKNQKEFDLVNRFGEKHNFNYFLAIISVANKRLNQKTPFVLGMKVSRKMGKAHVRNKIKRRIRHLSRIISNSTGDSRFALVIIPRKNFDKIKFPRLIAEFHKILSFIKTGSLLRQA